MRLLHVIFDLLHVMTYCCLHAEEIISTLPARIPQPAQGARVREKRGVDSPGECAPPCPL